jgi:SAM-dependent methyltransferase
VSKANERRPGAVGTVTEESVRSFWQARPCGEHIVGGLDERFHHDYERFFTEYDAWRYHQEGHILSCLDGIEWRDRDVLEIGLGQGAESEQLIRRGARWSGLDVTRESVDRVATRLEIRSLPHAALKQGSALEIPYEEASFDLVFSHGVLHHIPEIRCAQAEIHRVLRPGGVLVAMLYARRSLNYQLSIRVLRRGMLASAYPLRRTPLVPGTGILRDHLNNAERMGLGRYLRMDTFTHHNTDGPLNPFARVYTPREVERDFPDFELERAYQRYMHAPPLPVHGWPLADRLGWHLWVHLRARAGTSRPTSGNDRGTAADEASGTDGGSR